MANNDVVAKLCPSSPDKSGRHQLDSTMESGPCNCFFCGVSLKGVRYESYKWDEEIVTRPASQGQAVTEARVKAGARAMLDHQFGEGSYANSLEMIEKASEPVRAILEAALSTQEQASGEELRCALADVLRKDGVTRMDMTITPSGYNAGFNYDPADPDVPTPQDAAGDLVSKLEEAKSEIYRQREKAESRIDYVITALRSQSGLVEAVKPFKDFVGDLPEWDDPLRCVYESGIQYAVDLLAKTLGVDHYSPCEGTEDFDGDLGGTMFNILLEVMPKDADGDPMHPKEVRKALATIQESRNVEG